MSKFSTNMRSIEAVRPLTALATVGMVAVLLTGCSRPEETPSPSPAPTTVGSAPGAPGAPAPAAMPGGTQGDAAYYSKTYGAGAARPQSR